MNNKNPTTKHYTEFTLEYDNNKNPQQNITQNLTTV